MPPHELGPAVVTGAAQGIGAAVARALAAQGRAVALLDVDTERLAKTEAELRANGCDVVALAVDVTDREAVRTAVAAAKRRQGPPDLLANVAGVLFPATVLDTTPADWAATYAVNVTGLLTLVQAVVPGMVERRRGSVVAVTSNAGGVPRTGLAAYASSKAAASHLVRCLALEVAHAGVRCNVVAPGSTDTRMQNGVNASQAAAVAGDPATFRVGIPLGRIADPDDVAQAVLYLASPAARHVTGQDLYVDGGATLRA